MRLESYELTLLLFGPTLQVKYVLGGGFHVSERRLGKEIRHKGILPPISSAQIESISMNIYGHLKSQPVPRHR